MNAIFALSIKFNIGDSLMTAVATGILKIMIYY